MWEDAMHNDKMQLESSIHKTRIRSNSDQKELKKESLNSGKNDSRNSKAENIFNLF